MDTISVLNQKQDPSVGGQIAFKQTSNNIRGYGLDSYASEECTVPDSSEHHNELTKGGKFLRQINEYLLPRDIFFGH